MGKPKTPKRSPKPDPVPTPVPSDEPSEVTRRAAAKKTGFRRSVITGALSPSSEGKSTTLGV